MRCVTSPVNAASVAFHQRIGFAIEAQDDELRALRARSIDGSHGSRRVPIPGPVTRRGRVPVARRAVDDADHAWA